MSIKKILLYSMLVGSLFADVKFNVGDNLDKQVLQVEKIKLARNRTINIHSIDVILKKKLPNNWIGYMFNINLTAKNRTFDAKDMIFTNGKEITNRIKSLEGLDYKRLMHPSLDKRYYDKSFLIAGDENAKHKMVIFSDPLCPICINVVPDLISKIKKYPNEIALYYIHMPLKMHPTASLIVRAVLEAKKQGIVNMDYKIYTANFEKDFDAYVEQNQSKVLNIFNKKFNTKFTLEQISTNELKEEEQLGLKLSEDALVNGTPTVFFDGEIDLTRSKYLIFLK
jgi:hypothetical protein